jgi:hypothetical protein
MTTPARRLGRSPLVAFGLFVAVAFVGLTLWQTSQTAALRGQQLRACERGNGLRLESNRRIRSHRVERGVLADFLRAAEEARRAAGTANDRQAAERYHRLWLQLRRVTFRPTPLVDCRRVIT